MLRIIFLTAPIFVCLFWVIILADNPKSHSAPRSFFAKFMFLPLIIYFSHFLFHAPFPNAFAYFFNILNTYTSLFVFPAYYVYFRLLTVDEKFSWKIHGKYFIPAIIVATIYTVAVLIAPRMEYKTWLYNQNAYNASYYVRLLKTTATLVKITYLIQLIVVLISNFLLIKKYKERAEQFYSDMLDGKYNYAKRLNVSFLLISIPAFVTTALGRYILTKGDFNIFLWWPVFAIMLFIIGYLGFKLKPINPTFEVSTNVEDAPQLSEITSAGQQQILKKLEVEFVKKKAYLNNQLNIIDVAQAIGTNRTYISLIIKQAFNQNFCSYVNGFRIDELKSIYAENPHYTNESLAQSCGFGSVNSMKRTVEAKTGLSLTEWKKRLLL
jgi:AraC-like DNA-binding protein